MPMCLSLSYLFIYTYNNRAMVNRRVFRSRKYTVLSAKYLRGVLQFCSKCPHSVRARHLQNIEPVRCGALPMDLEFPSKGNYGILTVI